MALIALLSCTKLKKPYKCKAYEMYSESRWFPKAYEYVNKLSADRIFIISALYGLVSADKEIEPYEKTLNDCTGNERREWANKVLSDLRANTDLDRDSFIIIAGKNYYEYLIPHLCNVQLPLKGQSIFYWESTLNKLLRSVQDSTDRCSASAVGNIEKKKTDNYSYELHRLLNSLPRIGYPFNTGILPNNGIYIMFENGEKYGEFDRIVRVGTHRALNRLRGRLKDHYYRENKDGSIFRKNIGKALLNKNGDPYLKIWEYDLSRTNDQEILHHANFEYQSNIERKVSEYIRSNISFVIIGGVEDQNERLRLEAGIIATLNNDIHFTHSDNWLGIYSPKEEISNSGLWLVEGLEDRPLTRSEFDLIAKYTKSANEMLNKENCDVPEKTRTIDKDYRKEFSESLLEILNRAKAAGEEYVDVESGALHRVVGGYPGRDHKMPLCCKVMRDQMKINDMILCSPPSGKGATLRIRYYLK